MQAVVKVCMDFSLNLASPFSLVLLNLDDCDSEVLVLLCRTGYRSSESGNCHPTGC